MYNLLSIINILVGIICGNKAASDRVRTSRQYWSIMFWPILAFTLTYGLRYGWLIDFNLYESCYDEVHLDSEMQKGWLFDLLSRTGNYLGLPFNVLVCITDAVIIISYCAFIRPYKKYAAWILPIFYFLSFMCSNFISFYPALSLFLLAVGMHLRLEDKYNFQHPIKSGLIYPIIILLLAFGFHRAVIAAVLLYAIALAVNMRPAIAISLYAASFFFMQSWWMDFLKMAAMYAGMFEDSALSSYYDNYVMEAETFFNQEGTEMKEAGGSLFYSIRTLMANGFAIMLYYKYRFENNINNANDKILELSTIGLIYGNIAAGVPVFSRFGIPFQLTLPVLYSVAIMFGLKSRVVKYKMMALFIILIQGYFYFITMYLRDTTYFFYVWDSFKRNIYY